MVYLTNLFVLFQTGNGLLECPLLAHRSVSLTAYHLQLLQHSLRALESVYWNQCIGISALALESVYQRIRISVLESLHWNQCINVSESVYWNHCIGISVSTYRNQCINVLVSESVHWNQCQRLTSVPDACWAAVETDFFSPSHSLDSSGAQQSHQTLLHSHVW